VRISTWEGVKTFGQQFKSPPKTKPPLRSLKFRPKYEAGGLYLGGGLAQEKGKLFPRGHRGRHLVGALRAKGRSVTLVTVKGDGRGPDRPEGWMRRSTVVRRGYCEVEQWQSGHGTGRLCLRRPTHGFKKNIREKGLSPPGNPAGSGIPIPPVGGPGCPQWKVQNNRNISFPEIIPSPVGNNKAE